MPVKRIWPIFWASLALFLVVRTGVRDRGVITNHIEMGRRLFAAEDLNARFDNSALNAPYPPGFGLLWTPFTLLPERIARFA